MTSKEAIQEIINLANNLQIIPSTSTGQAVLMAIKSLEAWKEVKEEISEAYKDFQNDDTCIANGINICRRIIDKHLKELELN